MFHIPYHKVPAELPQAGQIHDDPRPRTGIAAIIPIERKNVVLYEHEIEDQEAA